MGIMQIKRSRVRESLTSECKYGLCGASVWMVRPFGCLNGTHGYLKANLARFSIADDLVREGVID